MHRIEFCKPDKSLNRETWLTGWQKFQSMWLSQEHFPSGQALLNFIYNTTSLPLKQQETIQWAILHFIWAQRPISWKVFFKKVEPWGNLTSSIYSVATTKIQLIHGTEHQHSTCSITELTLCNKKVIRQWEDLESLCQEQWERELSLTDPYFLLGTAFREAAPHHLRL